MEDMSTFLVILLCMDRLELLEEGTYYSTTRETSQRAKSKIFNCACASLLLNGPWLLLSRGSNNVCDIAFVFSLPIEITLFILDFLVPFFFITFINTRIYLAIRKQQMAVRSSISPTTYKRKLSTTTVPIYVKKSRSGSKGLVVSLPSHLEAPTTKIFPTSLSSLSKRHEESASSSNTERPSSTTTALDSKTKPGTHDQTTQTCQGQENVSLAPQTSMCEFTESMPTDSGRPVLVQWSPLSSDTSESEKATGANMVSMPSLGKIMRTRSASQGSLRTFHRQSLLPYFRFREKSQQDKQEPRPTLVLKKNHAAKVLIAIQLAMVVFWVPHRLTKLVKAACDECVMDTTFRLIELVSWMRPCVNPVLYAAHSPAFKKNFAQILEPCLYCLGIRFCFKK